MQMNKEILARGGKLLNFFVPVYKPAGMCGLKLGEAFKLDIYFVMEHHGINAGQVIMRHSRYLEPFASGVTTFGTGGKAKTKSKNFVLTDYEYELTIEFGVDRHLHCIDGEVIGRQDVSNLSEMKIRNQLPGFLGEIEQTRMKSYRIRQDDDRSPLSLLINPDFIKQGSSATEIINEITLPVKSTQLELDGSERKPQKYPYLPSTRKVTVRSIELMDYREPYGRFRISACGSFIARRFALDLAAALDTRASLVGLRRMKEGPMFHDDQLVLQPHELHLDYYVHRLPIYEQIYTALHDEIDPLWENIST